MGIVVDVSSRNPNIKCEFCEDDPNPRCLTLQKLSGETVVIGGDCLTEAYLVLAMNEGVG